MSNDYNILGIAETNDIVLIKAAYRKKIKEIHPDVATGENTFNNHLLFIRINQAYQRLIGANLKKQNAIPAESKDHLHGNPFGGKTHLIHNPVVLHKDQAYVFYKTGIKFFMQIHPSQWNLDANQMLKTTIPGHEHDQEVLKSRVKELIRLFPKAYYYFSIVVNEYPQSVWTADAKEKMTLIEERTLRYKKIIESFNIVSPRKIIISDKKLEW